MAYKSSGKQIPRNLAHANRASAGAATSRPSTRENDVPIAGMIRVLNDQFRHAICRTNTDAAGPARMPWVKDFDVETAVDRAMQVFWAKGYEATSMSDLVKAMEINKGSLYNAFNSKRELFTRAILKYDKQNRQGSLETLDALDDPLRAIRMLLEGIVAESVADADRKGCFLVNTALDLPNHEPETQAMVKQALAEFEAFFARQLESAKMRGEISASINPKMVAKSLLSQVVGLRVLARGVFDADDLKAIRDQALDQLAA